MDGDDLEDLSSAARSYTTVVDAERMEPNQLPCNAAVRLQLRTRSTSKTTEVTYGENY
jgi:hypothetical protein